MIKNVYWFACRVQVILVRLYRNFGFLDTFSKNTQVSNFMKIRPLGAELFHSDMTKLIVAFSNFANAPRNCRNLVIRQ